MGLNIKNAEVERLAAEIAAATGETKTEAIRKALEERRQRLALSDQDQRRVELMEFLRTEIWAKLPPPDQRRPWTKADSDALFE